MKQKESLSKFHEAWFSQNKDGKRVLTYSLEIRKKIRTALAMPFYLIGCIFLFIGELIDGPYEEPL